MHTRRSVVVAVALCASEEAREPAKPLAKVAISASRVDWQPAGDDERLVLTVAGPGGLYVQREFGAGETPSFSALDAKDGRLPDGVYAYELRAGEKKSSDIGPTCRTSLFRRCRSGPPPDAGVDHVQRYEFARR